MAQVVFILSVPLYYLLFFHFGFYYNNYFCRTVKIQKYRMQQTLLKRVLLKTAYYSFLRELTNAQILSSNINTGFIHSSFNVCLQLQNFLDRPNLLKSYLLIPMYNLQSLKSNFTPSTRIK